MLTMHKNILRRHKICSQLPIGILTMHKNMLTMHKNMLTMHKNMLTMHKNMLTGQDVR
jgi:hypothetical protein